MKSKIILLSAILTAFSITAAAQGMIRVRRPNEELLREQQAQSEAIARLKAMQQKAEQSRAHSNRNRSGALTKPVLNDSDFRAISIDENDLKRFADFLKLRKTGITRLQNAAVCSPENRIVQAINDCPNNVPGKGTAFSFRQKNYNIPGFSDIFFKENKFFSVGVLNFGIISNLGDVDIKNLNSATDGVKQLLEFQPSVNEPEVKRQMALLAKGVKIGSYVYQRNADLKENNSYLLRAIAYKGKIFKNSGTQKVNLLKHDERVDVTVIFRVIRKHDDGSVTIVWKELNRVAAPKTVSMQKPLTIDNKSGAEKKNS